MQIYKMAMEEASCGGVFPGHASEVAHASRRVLTLPPENLLNIHAIYHVPILVDLLQKHITLSGIAQTIDNDSGKKSFGAANKKCLGWLADAN
jgi:hypothetical protein